MWVSSFLGSTFFPPKILSWFETGLGGKCVGFLQSCNRICQLNSSKIRKLTFLVYSWHFWVQNPHCKRNWRKKCKLHRSLIFYCLHCLQKEPCLKPIHILSFPLPGPNSWITNIARAKRQQCLTSVYRLTICSTASFGQVVIAINL